MARFEDIGGGKVEDTETGLVWQKVPSAASLWDEAVAALVGDERIPTLDEMKTLLDGQKDVPADFAAAFGEDNAPVDWFWCHAIPVGKQAEWTAGPKTEALAEKLSTEKPGHVAAWSNWAGNKPVNRRILKAMLRSVE